MNKINFSSSLIVIALLVVLLSTLVSATHTASVSVSPSATKVYADKSFTLSVTNSGGDNIYKVDIQVPSGFGPATCGVLSGWNLYTNTTTNCGYQASSPDNRISSGNSKTFTIIANTSITSGNYYWTITSYDISSYYDPNDVTTEVDADKPLVSSVIVDSNPTAEGRVDIYINFNEAMNTSSSPTVKIQALSTNYTLSGSWSDADTWLGNFTLLDEDEEKTAIINITEAMDDVGNVMDENRSHTFSVDTHNPAIVSVAANPSSGILKIGSTLVATINASETGLSASCTLNGYTYTTAGSTITSVGNGNYTFTYTVVEGNTNRAAGNIPISCTFTDSVGNTNTTSVWTDSNTLAIDADRPTGTLSVNQSIVSIINKTIRVNVSYDEAMNGSANPTISFSGSTRFSSNSDGAWNAANTTWSETFTHNLVQEGGLYVTVSSSAAKDVAGNTETSSVTTNFYVDTDVPALSSVTIYSNNDLSSSRAKNGTSVSIDFTSDEELASGSVIICLFLGDARQNCSNSGVSLSSSNNVNWEADYTFTGGEPEGLVNFSINFSDSVANNGTQVIAVTDGTWVRYDQTAPQITSVSVNQSIITRANISNVVKILVDFNENMSSSSPTLTFAPSVSSLLSCSNSWANVTAYQSLCTVTSTEGELGSVNYTISNAKDLSDNAIVSNLSENLFYLDLRAPVYSDVANRTLEYNNALGYDINATDLSNVSCFSVNDSTNFKVNCSGYLENNTLLAVNLYQLNVTVNDSFNNLRSVLMWVNITDTTAPNLTLNSPAADYVNDSALRINVTFNCSASDNYALRNISLYLTNGYNASFARNQTTSVSGTSSTVNWTVELIRGNYTWGCLAYDNYSNSNYSVNRSVVLNLTDSDNDWIADSTDKLYYNESNVTLSGVSNLNITIGGNSTSGSYYSGVYEVNFYNGSTLLVNFTHNFSAGTLDLSKVKITKDTNSIIVNFSSQVQGNYNKTVYIADNSFASLCVKDAEIAAISEVSSGCNGANETDFSSCLGSSLTSNGIVCTDLGSTIEIKNLAHSAIRGTPATTSSSSSSSSSSSGGGGGSGGTPVTYFYTDANFTTIGDTFNLYANDKVKMSINHTLTLMRYYSWMANVLFSSDAFSMDLESGKMYSVDLNNDKVNDINIKYLGINSTNGRGIFFIQALNKPLPVAEMPKETVTAETDTSTTAELGNVAETQSELETVAPVTEAPESKSKIMLLAGIVLLVLAVLFGLFIWWYAKKNAHHHR